MSIHRACCVFVTLVFCAPLCVVLSPMVVDDFVGAASAVEMKSGHWFFDADSFSVGRWRVTGSGPDVIVDPAEDDTDPLYNNTIRDAIDYVSSGSLVFPTIYVTPGVYVESITIVYPIVLVGNGALTSGDYTKIEGTVTFSSSGGSGSYMSDLWVVSAIATEAVVVSHASGVTIDACRIQGTQSTGVRLSTDNNVIIDSALQGCPALSLTGSYNTIRGCDMARTLATGAIQRTVYLAGNANHNIFKDNTIRNAYLSGTDPGYGLWIYSLTGVESESPSNNLFVDNTFHTNQYNIVLQNSGGHGNTFYRNDFYEPDTKHIAGSGGGHPLTLHGGDPATGGRGGNWWYGAGGSDRGDGILTPIYELYSIPPHVYDSYPIANQGDYESAGGNVYYTGYTRDLYTGSEPATFIHINEAILFAKRGWNLLPVWAKEDYDTALPAYQLLLTIRGRSLDSRYGSSSAYLGNSGDAFLNTGVYMESVLVDDEVFPYITFGGPTAVKIDAGGSYGIRVSGVDGSLLNISRPSDGISWVGSMRIGWIPDGVSQRVALHIYNALGSNGGIEVSNSNDIFVMRAKIYDSYVGITAEISSDITIKENTIYNSDYGITTLGGGLNTISYNTMQGCDEYGIAVLSSHINTITYNDINGCGANPVLAFGGGLRVDDSTLNTIHRNVFRNNYGSLYFSGTGNTGNEFINNDFVNNRHPSGGHVNGVTTTYNIWNDNYSGALPTRGNYWDDYYSPDEYSGQHQDVPGSDGVVDNPLYIFGPANTNNIDEYPLTTYVAWEDVVGPIPTHVPATDFQGWGAFLMGLLPLFAVLAAISILFQMLVGGGRR